MLKQSPGNLEEEFDSIQSGGVNEKSLRFKLFGKLYQDSQGCRTQGYGCVDVDFHATYIDEEGNTENIQFDVRPQDIT